MVDAHVSGTCEAIHGGSSPLSGTKIKLKKIMVQRHEIETQIQLTSQGKDVAVALQTLLQQRGITLQRGVQIPVTLLNELFANENIALRFSDARSYLTKDLLLFMLPQGLNIEFVSSTQGSYYVVV